MTQSNFFPSPTEQGLRIKTQNTAPQFYAAKTMTVPTKMILRPHQPRTLQILLTSPHSFFPQTSNNSLESAGAHAIPNRIIQGSDNDAVFGNNRDAQIFDYIDDTVGYADYSAFQASSDFSGGRSPENYKNYLRTFMPRLNGEMLLNHYLSTQNVINHPTRGQPVVTRIPYFYPAIAIVGPISNAYQSGENVGAICAEADPRSKQLNSTSYNFPGGQTQSWQTLAAAFVLPGTRNRAMAGNTYAPLVLTEGTARGIEAEYISSQLFTVSMPVAGDVRPFVVNIIEMVHRPVEQRDIFWLQPGDTITNTTCQLIEFDVGTDSI